MEKNDERLKIFQRRLDKYNATKKELVDVMKLVKSKILEQERLIHDCVKEAALYASDEEWEAADE
jgi:hypothetical protein